MYTEQALIHEDRELPMFTLRQIDLPDILKWQVGGKYYLVMKVEMVGLRNRKDLDAYNDRPKVEGDFQVMSIRALGDKPVDATTIEKEDFKNVVTKVKSGEY
jgi:hypothetical protein